MKGRPEPVTRSWEAQCAGRRRILAGVRRSCSSDVSVSIPRSNRAPHDGADVGWGPRIDGRLVVIDNPGDHRSLLSKTHVGFLASRLVITMRDGVNAMDQFTNRETRIDD